jgi:hypothetical protein
MLQQERDGGMDDRQVDPVIVVKHQHLLVAVALR